MEDRKLTNWLEAYLNYASYGESPMKFHQWTGLSMLAGAVRKRCWLDMGLFEWTPGLFIVLVAPPGIAAKSTTIGVGTQLLKEVPEINFGPSSMTWQALISRLAECTEIVQTPTGERKMSPMTLVASELGTLLDPTNRELIDMLTDLWDGRTGIWEKATKSSGTERIESPWINLIAATTPSWLAQNFPEELIGQGFSSRCIFVYADEKRQLVAYPRDTLPASHADIGLSLIHDLEQISLLAGEFTLSPTARAFGEAWYEDHYTRYLKHRTPLFERFADYYSRKPTHLHKVAMLLSVARTNSLTIEIEDMENALVLLNEAEVDMPRVFSRIGQTPITRAVESIISVVQMQAPFPVTELYVEFVRFMPLKDFEEALRSALQTGKVRRAQEKNEWVLYPGEKR